MRLLRSCLILWRRGNIQQNQRVTWFVKRFSGGAYSPVTEMPFLCITGAAERLVRSLSSEIFFAFVNLPNSDVSQCVDQYSHQGRVSVGRNTVAQIGDIAMMRIESGE